jgi:serine/threonine protein phosphatase PrpC
VFSAEFDRFVTIAPDRLVSFFPLGVFPSEDDIDDGKEVAALQYKPRYTVNEVNLMGAGDVLLLYSDGLSEHSREGETYVPRHLERTMREVKHTSARDVFQAIRDQVLAFATRRDDISLVVIKRTR